MFLCILQVRTGSQYYFYMETQTALAIPDEDNCMVIYNSSQNPEYLQQCISTCLGIPHHNVRAITRRVGGGFGGKASRNVTVNIRSPCDLMPYFYKFLQQVTNRPNFSLNKVCYFYVCSWQRHVQLLHIS